MINFLNFSKKYFFAFLTLSVIFVGISQLWGGEMVYKDEDLKDLRSGSPVKYRSADFITGDVNIANGVVGLYKYPQKMSGFNYPEQSTTTTVWPVFFLDIVIMQIVFTAVLFFVYSFIPRAEYFFKILSVKYILLVLFLFLAITIGPAFILTGNRGSQYQETGGSVVPPSPFVNSAPVRYPIN